MIQELKKARDLAEEGHKESNRLLDEEERWLRSFEKTRLKLNLFMSTCMHENEILKLDGKLLFEKGMPRSTSATSAAGVSRARRSLSFKDLLEDLEDSRLMQDIRLKECEKLLLAGSGSTISTSASSSHKGKSSAVYQLAVDELDYPWDHECVAQPPRSSEVNINTEQPTDSQVMLKMFNQIEELIKTSETYYQDVEAHFLRQEEDAESAAMEGSHVTWAPFPDQRTQRSLYEPLMKLGSSEHKWLEHLQHLDASLAQAAKRRKLGGQSDPVMSYDIPMINV